jgi:hypothetical protein
VTYLAKIAVKRLLASQTEYVTLIPNVSTKEEGIRAGISSGETSTFHQNRLAYTFSRRFKPIDLASPG